MELKGGVGRNDPVPLTCQDGNASIARAEEQTVSLPARTRTMAVTSAAGLGRPRRWAAGLAWGLWALAMLGLAVVPWMDRLIIRAGRPDLAAFVPGSVVGPVLAVLSAATVGAVLASRRPRHPVGWLLLGFALSLTASGVIGSYVDLRAGRPARGAARRQLVRPALRAASTCRLACIGFILLLTPTGSLPSPRWRWWAGSSAAPWPWSWWRRRSAPGPLDPGVLSVRNPLDRPCSGGALRSVHVLALAVAVLGMLVGAGSLVVRFRRARGVERLQLRWVALAAALAGGGVLVLRGPAGLGTRPGRLGLCRLRHPPALATGAAILRYRLYDLDRIVSRTLAYGLLTVLLGWRLRRRGPGPGPAPGPGLQPGRGRARPWPWPPPSSRPAAASRQAVDRRFNRRRHDAARTIAGVRRPPARPGRPRHPDRRAAGGGRPDHAANPGLAVAATPSAVGNGWCHPGSAANLKAATTANQTTSDRPAVAAALVMPYHPGWPPGPA